MLPAYLAPVADVLEESQRIGIIGRTPIDVEIARSLVVASAVRNHPGRIVDLGSGGGLPALVIAAELTERSMVLCDRREKRTDFLRRAVRRLGLAGRVDVVAGELPDCLDGEEFGVATARSFGQPAVVAATASSLVVPGGVLAVSEPPDGGDVFERWQSVADESSWHAEGSFSGLHLAWGGREVMDAAARTNVALLRR